MEFLIHGRGISHTAVKMSEWTHDDRIHYIPTISLRVSQSRGIVKRLPKDTGMQRLSDKPVNGWCAALQDAVRMLSKTSRSTLAQAERQF